MKKISLYFKPSCPWCKKVRDYLNSRNLPYEAYDVSQDEEKAAEMFDKSGQEDVPVIDIEGDLVIGFDQNSLNNLLR